MKFIKCKLSELGEIVGGSTPFTKNESYYGGDIPWLTPKDLANFNGRYINFGERNITEAGYKSTSVKMLPINSVLFSSRAPIGYVAINNKNEVCTNQGFKSVIPNSKTDYMFLYYLLKYNKNKIEAMGSGTTFKEVSGAVMKNIIVNVPEAKEDQIKIGKILSKIDDKIELNTHTNDNLFEMSVKLFNNFLNNNKDIENVKLKECVERINTGADAIQRAPIVEYDTGIRCIRIGDMTNNRPYHCWGFTKMTEKDFANYQLLKNDIVITRTAVNGLTYMITDEKNVVCNNGNIRLRVNKKFNPLYIYLYTKTKEFRNYIDRINSETSVRPNMKVEYLTDFSIKNLSLDNQNQICQIIQPLMTKIHKNITENHTLEQMRDSLLPKLMNGEIDLDKIEIY